MIATSKKDINEILNLIENEKNIVIVGCGLCATTFKTGGKNEVEELKNILIDKNKKILNTEVIDAVCDQRQVKLFLNKNSDIISKTDSIIVLACGAGVQAFKELVTDKKIHPGLDTLFLATEKRLGYFYQYCSMCGDCKLELTSSICTTTRCPKGFLNGPCGGSKNGKCEAFPENDCVWNLISKIENKNFYEKHIQFVKPRDYRKNLHPQKIEKKL